MDTVPAHYHNGTDSPRLKIGDMVQIVDAVPAYPAKEGTLALYVNGSTYRIYVRVNQLWKYCDLT